MNNTAKDHLEVILELQNCGKHILLNYLFCDILLHIPQSKHAQSYRKRNNHADSQPHPKAWDSLSPEQDPTLTTASPAILLQELQPKPHWGLMRKAALTAPRPAEPKAAINNVYMWSAHTAKAEIHCPKGPSKQCHKSGFFRSCKSVHESSRRKTHHSAFCFSSSCLSAWRASVLWTSLTLWENNCLSCKKCCNNNMEWAIQYLKDFIISTSNWNPWKQLHIFMYYTWKCKI